MNGYRRTAWECLGKIRKVKQEETKKAKDIKVKENLFYKYSASKRKTKLDQFAVKKNERQPADETGDLFLFSFPFSCHWRLTESQTTGGEEVKSAQIQQIGAHFHELIWKISQQAKFKIDH